MSSASVQHPSDRLLSAFNAGTIDDAKAAAVKRHLNDCPTCRRRLVKLSGELAKPDTSPKSAADGAKVKVAKVALSADRNEQTPTAIGTSARGLKLLWPLAAGGTVLAGLVVAWSAGLFSAKPGVPVAADATGHSAISPQPPKASDQPASLKQVSPAASANPNVAQVSELHANPKLETPTTDKKPPEKPLVVDKLPQTGVPAVALTVSPAQKTPSIAKPSTPVKDSPGSFFDGKDLVGWQGSPTIWRVENGSIVGSLPAVDKQSAVLVSQKKYRDFDLRFRVSVAGGVGDCAVHFRSQVVEGNRAQVIGPECAIYGKDPPKDRRTGSLITEPGRKVVKAPPPKRVERFVKPGENHYRIRCQGKHVLIEVNGIKMVNADLPPMPDEGVIAWKIDEDRPPHTVTFKIIKFTELTGVPSQSAPERPSLADADLLKAELKFEGATRRADENLLKRFDAEINKLQHSSRAQDKELVAAVEHEKEVFKEKGLIPWSRPMRKLLAQYGKELRDARRTVGNAFDSAIDRADKAHADKLKEALLAEAAQVLAPREVAKWQLTDHGRVFTRIFYSDGTYAEADQNDESSSRFWSPPVEDVLVLEFPDPKDPTATNQQGFELTPDGKTLIAMNKKGEKRFWRRVEDVGTSERSE